MNRIIHIIGVGCILPFILLVHYTLTHYGMLTAAPVFLIYQLKIRWSVSALCNFFLGIVLILIFRCQLLVAVIIIFELKLIIRGNLV